MRPLDYFSEMCYIFTTMKKIVLLISLFAGMGAALFAQEAVTNESGAYNVGDTGPAGGIIFFDKGSISDDWRYLEAAPAETEFTAEWGAFNRDIQGTGTAVGSGKNNTRIIVDMLKQFKENNRAAEICTGLNINDFTDWFIPSKDELDLIYKNLKQKGLGGFKNNWYWSSSQRINTSAWSQRFNDGHQDYHTKNITRSVRAVRAF